MADHTYIHTGPAGLTKASSPCTGTAVLAWFGGRVRMDGNEKSLAERWKG